MMKSKRPKRVGNIVRRNFKNILDFWMQSFCMYFIGFLEGLSGVFVSWDSIFR